MNKLKLPTSVRSATLETELDRVLDATIADCAVALSSRFQPAVPAELLAAFDRDTQLVEADCWRVLMYAKKRKPQPGDKFLWYPEDVKIARVKPFFRVDQPRAPAGTSEGGQWVSDDAALPGGGSGSLHLPEEFPQDYRYWGDDTDALERLQEGLLDDVGALTPAVEEAISIWTTNEYRNVNTYLRTGESAHDLEALYEEATELLSDNMEDFEASAKLELGEFEDWAAKHSGFSDASDLLDDARSELGDLATNENLVAARADELLNEKWEALRNDYDTKFEETVQAYFDSAKDDYVNEKLSDPPDRVIDPLDKMFEKASFPVDAVTFRGFDSSFLDVHGKDLTGAIITDDGFISSTIDSEQAFGKGSHHPRSNVAQAEILVPKGAKAVYIGPWSSIRSEEEVLINRGSQFKVLGQKADGTYRLQLLIDGKDPYTVEKDPNQLEMEFSLWNYAAVCVYYDPDQPRDPAGTPTGGRWTATGGFVSPNVKEGTTLADAAAALNSARHAALVRRFYEVDEAMGMAADTGSGIGAWVDGAEDSTYSWYGSNEDPEAVRAALAMKGLLADQKAVAHFQFDPDGDDVLYRVSVSGASLNDLHKGLLDAGIQNHTIVKSGEDHYFVYAIQNADSGELAQSIAAFGKQHGGQYDAETGRATFIGSWTSREEGRAEYEKVIEGYFARTGLREVQSRWEAIRNSWLSEAKEKGLTQGWYYDPNQPRVPAGQSGGGQWTDGDGGWGPVIEGGPDDDGDLKERMASGGGKLTMVVQEPHWRKIIDEKLKTMMPGKTVEDIENLMAEMADGTDTDLVMNLRLVIDGGDPVLRMFFQSKEQPPQIDIERQLYRDNAGNLVGDNSSFFLKDESKQGAGYAKTFLKNQIEAYQKIGVQRITLDAAEVGSYAWARFGFTPTDQYWDEGFRHFVAGEIESMGGISPKTRTYLSNAVRTEGPKSIWKVADARHGDINIGKQVLMGHRWEGELVLSDKEAMDRFNKYVGA